MQTIIVRQEIASLLDQAVRRAQDKGLLPPVAVPAASIERPANPAHGDYASTVALKLARSARMSPADIARILVRELPASPLIGAVNIAGPGFINFTLSDTWLAEQVNTIVTLGDAFGSLDLGHDARVQVEFVSANPTGPLPVAAGRGGALGDSLARLLATAGYKVWREYYVNDHGSRIDVFGQSIYARYAQEFGRDVPVPADGYHGTYLIDFARHLKDTQGDRFLQMPPSEAQKELARLGIAYFLDGIRSDLERLGIEYDCWFSEQRLYDDGEVERVLDLLRQRGYVATREGAVWFVSSVLGEDKDNVLVRSNGEPTYFASDIAYHYNKLAVRGFDRVIDVWGADHQGHVGRTRAAVGALDLDTDRLQIIIHQLVTLRVGGQPARMSKRAGHLITLREVLDEVGPDACRFFFVSRSADSHLDFDLDLARKQSDENPVYYVQYAHARIASILRYAGGIDYQDADVSLLRHPAELTLIRKMLELPEVIEAAVLALEPHHLPHYALELASEFHSFYTQCRVVSDDPALTRARLKLVDAARITLRNTLDLIGVRAPEQM
ncbi:MAG: arginine--tRNA ligase [Chloroflexi bacterium]|nr:arginine--tRNA ligase [Chloroflexota bacterium]